MKKNYFILLAMALMLHTTSWAQPATSYGGIQGAGTTAGNGGGFVNSYFGHEAGINTFTGGGDTFIGYRSGYSHTSGGNNTFVGSNSGRNTTTGEANTFIGSRSGFDNTIGDHNIFVGYQSGANNIEGSHNTFLGIYSGYNNTYGIGNIFIGENAGYSNIEGGGNIFLGNSTGIASTTGYNNTFIGYYSGTNNITGDDNTFIGYRSGNNNTGSNNVFLGYHAGYNELGSNRLYIDNSSTSEPLIWGDFTDGSEQLRFNSIVGIGNLPSDNTLTHILVADPVGNINYREASSLETAIHITPSYPASAGNAVNNNSFFGDSAGAITTGADNTLVGFQSGLNNTTGYENSSLGSRTLENNTTGARNTANGVFTLFGNTIGNENTAVGYAALGFNSTGNGNTANGYQTLLNNSGNHNTANGYQSLINNTSGSNNTAMGYSASIGNTTGSNNVALGREALSVNETGSENIAIGNGSGTNNIDFSNTISIGAVATVGASHTIAIGAGASAGGEYSVAIGEGAIINADNEMILGNLGTTHIRANVMGFSPLSDARFKTNVKENITGLDFIKKLRPVSYQVERTKLHSFLTGKEAPKNVKNDVSMGFIAQEVEQVVTENDYIFTGIKKPANEKDHYGLRYVEFVVPLVKSVQELSAENNEQKQRIEALEQEMETLKVMVYGTGDTNPSSPGTNSKTETILTKGFSLAQNIPNPFNEITTIVAEIPSNVTQAKIVIYNLQGIELRSYSLTERGRTSVEIKGGSLQSGIYLYALLADGQLIDTKKMILTK